MIMSRTTKYPLRSVPVRETTAFMSTMSDTSSVGSIRSLHSHGSPSMDDPMGLQDNLNATSYKAATHWGLPVEEERGLIPILTTRKSKARDTMSLRGSVLADANNHLNKLLYPAQKRAPKSQSSKWGNQLTAAATEVLPQTPSAALTSSHISSESTRDLEFTSASRGKRKYNLNALDDRGSPQKRSCSSSAAKARQEGSAALTSIAQVLLQLIDSVAASSTQPEHPHVSWLRNRCSLQY
ncbi:hypothetical protein BDR04DRAFT_556347 [Suillus decipiens]|nr:hypothetical protein BDR04DRAFT_556347 [Suillus decipiens]